MKKSYAVLIAGFLFLLVGIGLGYNQFMSYWQGKHVAKVLTVPFSTAATAGMPAVQAPAQPISGKPVRFQVPALKLDLSVVDGHFDPTTKTWTLSKDKAHYAVNTPLANNTAGNTFIYGHNRPGVFKTLYQVKAGDQAIVTTDNGHTFTYTFKAAYETNPNDDSLFHYQGAPILTVQTCSGLWYQNRQLFTFTLEKVV
jgi:LPXTG-site transpeptidase (sortase) family protein